MPPEISPLTMPITSSSGSGKISIFLVDPNWEFRLLPYMLESAYLTFDLILFAMAFTRTLLDANIVGAPDRMDTLRDSGTPPLLS